jgi:hypothetical protein
MLREPILDENRAYPTRFPSRDKADFMKTNYIPADVDLKFANFEAFFKARKELLRSKLTRVLEPLT